MQEQLTSVVHEFVTHDSLSSLMQTMHRLLNGYMQSSDLDGSDSALVTEVVEEATRINTFFAELYEISR